MKSETFDELFELIDQFEKQKKLIYGHYSRLVEAVEEDRITPEREIERIMDGLLDFGDDDDFRALYKRVCRHVFDTYPQMVGEHVYLFRAQFEEQQDESQEENAEEKSQAAKLPASGTAEAEEAKHPKNADSLIDECIKSGQPCVIAHFNEETGEITSEQQYNMQNLVIPQDAIDSLADALLPEIQKFYDSEEGRRVAEQLLKEGGLISAE